MRVALFLLLLVSVAVAQTVPSVPLGPSGLGAPPADYQLGAGDQFSVTVPDLETDFTGKVFRIDSGGDVTVPLAGRVHGAGLSTAGLEDEIGRRLARILKNPDVSVSLVAFGSKSVSILGSVNSPGIRQIETGKNLFEVLSLAGGLRPDAGYVIHLTRDKQWGVLPLANARMDAAGTHSIASVRVKSIMNGADSGENIPIMPGDTISVPKAEVVYAVGNVTRPGGFALDEHETLSAMQVVSLAGGPTRTAARDKAKIIRTVEGSSERVEIPVDLKALMSGTGTDVQLRAGDILFVPNSDAKSAGFRTLDAIVGAAGSALIYARP